MKAKIKFPTAVGQGPQQLTAEVDDDSVILPMFLNPLGVDLVVNTAPTGRLFAGIGP